MTLSFPPSIIYYTTLKGGCQVFLNKILTFL
uniref:Uncharacterized protein n=1 Tax=Phage sp. ctIHi3 TaxID=2825791 RepID=A0A8S5Q7D5_9VIRU|nr:MAG TPA: hypothetical protein [Phage sp. ctIHi3]